MILWSLFLIRGIGFSQKPFFDRTEKIILLGNGIPPARGKGVAPANPQKCQKAALNRPKTADSSKRIL